MSPYVAFWVTEALGVFAITFCINGLLGSIISWTLSGQQLYYSIVSQNLKGAMAKFKNFIECPRNNERLLIT